MKTPSTLVFSPRPREALRLADALRAAAVDVTCAEVDHVAAELVAACAVDAVVVDADAGVPASVWSAARSTHTPVVGISARAGEIGSWVRDCGLSHVVVAPGCADAFGAIEPRDLRSTIAKLVAGTPFGIARYVASAPIAYTIRDGAGAHRAAVHMRDDLRARGLERHEAARAALLAHQLAERAVDGGGAVKLAIAVDADALAVGARFGPVEVNALLDAVPAWLGDARSASPLADALGVPSVVAWCRSLVVNVAPDVATEIIGILPRRIEAPPPAALHLSLSRALARDDAVPRASIDLSDSMRQQLRATLARGPAAGGVCEPIAAECTAGVSLAPAATVDVLAALRASAGGTAALKCALDFLATRFAGGVVFEVAGGAARVWGAAGTIADPRGLQAFFVALDDACALAFVAREAALVRGAPGRSGPDRALARLVAGVEGAYALSLSVAVGGGVRYILYGAQPRGSADRAAADLELVGAELARALARGQPGVARSPAAASLTA